MSSIVAIVSSPEKGANTDTIVQTMAAEAKEKGHDVQIFYLNQLPNLRGCQSCFACKTKNRCVQKDSVTPILDAIRDADGMILSTPVYFNDQTAQYRTLEDRFFSFMTPSFDININPGKKIAVVVTAGSGAAAAESVANKIETVMGMMKCVCIGKMTVITNNDTGYSKSHPEVLAKAKEIAQKF